MIVMYRRVNISLCRRHFTASPCLPQLAFSVLWLSIADWLCWKPIVELFVPENEQRIIRRLSCRLRYLTEESVDYLQCSAGSLDALVYEGNAGALELLHATADDLCVTKYQALFRNDASFRTYRRAFFSALPSDLILRTAGACRGTSVRIEIIPSLAGRV